MSGSVLLSYEFPNGTFITAVYFDEENGRVLAVDDENILYSAETGKLETLFLFL